MSETMEQSKFVVHADDVPARDIGKGPFGARPKWLAWAAGTQARTSARATTATVAMRDIDRNIGYPSSNTGPIHWEPAEPTGFKASVVLFFKCDALDKP